MLSESDRVSVFRHTDADLIDCCSSYSLLVLDCVVSLVCQNSTLACTAAWDTHLGLSRLNCDTSAIAFLIVFTKIGLCLLKGAMCRPIVYCIVLRCCANNVVLVRVLSFKVVGYEKRSSRCGWSLIGTLLLVECIKRAVNKLMTTLIKLLWCTVYMQCNAKTLLQSVRGVLKMRIVKLKYSAFRYNDNTIHLTLV